MIAAILLLAQFLPFPGPGRAPTAGAPAGPPATNRTLWLDPTDNNSLYGSTSAPWSSQGRTDGQAISGIKDTSAPTVIGANVGDCVLETSGINGLSSIDCTAQTAGYGLVDPDDNSVKNLSSIMTVSDFAYLGVIYITSDCRAGTLSNGWTDASSLFNDASAWMGIYCRYSGGQNYIGYSNYDSNYDTVEVPISLNTRYIVVARHTGGNIYISVNGGSETSTASGNTGSIATVARILLAYSASSVVMFPGLVGEEITYDAGAVPTVAYNYLAAKW